MSRARTLSKKVNSKAVTPVLADFWIFSDQAKLLDPVESAASKEPRSGLVLLWRELRSMEALGEIKRK